MRLVHRGWSKHFTTPCSWKFLSSLGIHWFSVTTAKFLRLLESREMWAGVGQVYSVVQDVCCIVCLDTVHVGRTSVVSCAWTRCMSAGRLLYCVPGHGACRRIYRRMQNSVCGKAALVRGTIKRTSSVWYSRSPAFHCRSARSCLLVARSRLRKITGYCPKLNLLQLIFLNCHTIWRGTVVLRFATG